MDSCVMPAVADVGHDEVLSGSTCPLEKSCRGLGELVASQMTDENALVEASLSAGTSASERSQHCSSSYRTPDDPPSYPPSPSSPFPNYPLFFEEDLTVLISDVHIVSDRNLRLLPNLFGYGHLVSSRDLYHQTSNHNPIRRIG